MDISLLISILAFVIAALGLAATYFKFIRDVEKDVGQKHTDMSQRLTRVETQLELIPHDKLFVLISQLLNRIPPASANPHDRRAELLQRLERYEITPWEARELRELVERDVERSSEDETTKALILIGLGMLLGYALSKGKEK